MSDPERRTRPHGDERRRRILEVATRLFSERGWNAVSIAEVAQEAGLSQAGLLYHFPSKRDLLLAILQERERTEAAMPTGLDFFTGFARNLELSERNPAMVQLFAVLSSEAVNADHPAHDWFVTRYTDLVALATREIDAMVDPDRLPDGVDSRMIAQWVIGLADGLRTQVMLNPGSVDRHRSVERFLDLLRPYLRDAG
ncbi:TetR/AcrR family transcriptional regulator [Actinotalea sp. M2MS4P-6]|uniref:TetR/AcrR family transcriptional regulator n=1 Tax=Actinotalea sp. M2MS4P-6 TaxID=2983762 RepID=UPI0021E41948|nr:TetR/AcrR family transcriptional regulator [Actinotalea sp. M2MS4P-6]MCV2395166.1 TetR/AcrR family transcriptional regulator [Actinotalea sp. M2MS4P-6]